MPTLSRRSVLLALGATFSTAGCLSDTVTEDPPEETTSESPTATTDGSPKTTIQSTETTETTAKTATSQSETDVATTANASGSPEPDHEVTATNQSNETRTVRVWVGREKTGETVFETTKELSPGTETELYNLLEADPDGIETFSVCGRPTDRDANTKSCETIRTNACYGNAYVSVDGDGSIEVFYSIC